MHRFSTTLVPTYASDISELDLEDLETAITSAKQAVNATPTDHPNRASWLNNLGNHLGNRYERTRNIEDLEAAITHAGQAVKSTAEDHPDRASWLNNFGVHLATRYERTGDLIDLEVAITHAEQLLETTPEAHPDRALWLNNLGNRLSSRYERTGDLEDLNTAITHAEQAIKITPQDHPNRTTRLNNLGLHLRSRYEQTGDLEDLEAAIDAWIVSWSVPTASILERIQGAAYASDALVFRLSSSLSPKNIYRACPILHDATHLIPLATSRSLKREDQQQILRDLHGLASLAAAVSLEAGQSPLEALRLHELGRSITNSQLLDYRSDISDLMDQHPMLAKDFDSLRQELDSPFLPMESLSDPFGEATSTSMDYRRQRQQAAIRRRKKVAKDLDDILHRIWQQSGFQSFLRAESEEYFLSAAQEGPIVLLSATKLRSDAILLTKQHVTSLPLPKLSHALVVEYLGTNADDNEVKRELLEWLWSRCRTAGLTGTRLLSQGS